MCSNITTQHIEDLKLISVLSIAVDESCDINDTAQASLFVRFMSHSGPKEELLRLLPLKGQTHGEDIANAVIECMDIIYKHHIPLDKIVSISTDRAKSMAGEIKAFRLENSVSRTNRRSVDPKLLFHGRRYVSSKSA
ncbi:uncharacterized protein TNCV_3467461 [Trichonephila clavipes]|nr:uncharacterized protein TNCV_3467461 [Trichonephila clavipes]